jgi:hypothetical protein
MLAVATSTHVSAAILSDVVALSRQLRTPPLPATRVPVEPALPALGPQAQVNGVKGYWRQPVLPALVTQARVADRPGNARLSHSVGRVQQLHKQPRVAQPQVRRGLAIRSSGLAHRPRHKILNISNFEAADN